MLVVIIALIAAIGIGALTGALFFVTKSRKDAAVLEPALKPAKPVKTPVPPVVEEAEAILEQIEREGQIDLDVPVEIGDAVTLEKPKFRDRIGRARDLFSGFSGGLRKRGVTDATWDDLEEALLRADVGVGVATELLDAVRTRAKDENITSPEAVLDVVRTEMLEVFSRTSRVLEVQPGDGPNVWLFVGVNGVGKTTTIGKVSKVQSELGHRVVMAAGDTFRAAAADQLQMWAERTGAGIIRGAEGADPGSVVFDAVEHANAKDVDLVLADTAGRLQNKVNLMEELRKVHRIAQRPPARLTEVLLVLDATTGQNGLSQAMVFGEAVQCTGVVLTKLDGTAKGGVAFAIERQLGLPIKLVGLGEQAEDLVPFDPEQFVDALLSE